jgi:hypothetical protein
VFTAIATRNIGVVETFICLLWLTWRSLDQNHALAKKLSIDGEDLVATAARQLGLSTPFRELIASRLGISKMNGGGSL